ncbi:MAG: hypothetical protein K0M45_00190 [Candidatus Paracaedibacteraceae bacterium]|nr:hypothetical protein [Candidatus Paracaedibacteraceae bacterium]
MNYITQASTMICSAAQVNFWNEDALTIADMFESVYDDRVDSMVVKKASVSCHSGCAWGHYLEYQLDENNEFYAAELEFTYEYEKDGLVYTVEAWGELDFNGDIYEDMYRIRATEKIISSRPASQEANNLLDTIDSPSIRVA